MLNLYSCLFPSSFLLLLIGISIAQELPELGSILPKIDQDDYKLTPVGNGYELQLTSLNGSTRDEIVELKIPGTSEQYIAVMGTSKFLYPGVTATITYTADKKGYVVKYKYEMVPKGVTLNAGALKAAAG